jgi:hypothetical protein
MHNTPDKINILEQDHAQDSETEQKPDSELEKQYGEWENPPVKEAAERLRSGVSAMELISMGIADIEGVKKLSSEALKLLIGQYLESVNFTDTKITIRGIAEMLRDINISTCEVPPISPISSDIGSRMSVLGKLREAPLGAMQVAVVNIGGTNASATIAEVNGGEITLRETDDNAFRNPEDSGRPMRCTDHIDYWRHTVPSKFLQTLKSLVEAKSKIAIEIAVPLPVKDGRVVHMSDKATFKSKPLAPANVAYEEQVGLGEISKYPTIAESFSQFLETYGINIPAESIYTGENDTINVVLGNPAVAAEIMDGLNGIGGVVDGTGFNVCVFNMCGYGYNLEIGHLKLGTECDLDKAVSEKAGIALDIESCVSGKILGNVLKLAVSELAYATSLCKLIDSMDKDKLNALIFSVGFGEALSEEFSSLSEGEKTILIELCSRFAERAAAYMAAILGGISRKNNGVRFLYEGSVLEKNPAFVESVNKKCGGEQPILISSPKKEHPLSFYGAINDVTAKSTLATLAEWEPVYRKDIKPKD